MYANNNFGPINTPTYIAQSHTKYRYMAPSPLHLPRNKY